MIHGKTQAVAHAAVSGGGWQRVITQLALVAAGIAWLFLKDDPTIGYMLLAAGGAGGILQGIGAATGGGKK